MWKPYPTARRLPPLADPDDLPEEQREEYDAVMQTVSQYNGTTSVSQARNYVDGEPYAKGYWSALTQAPRVFTGLRAAGQSVQRSQGEPGSYRPSDHEWIDLILGFDSGYWGLFAGHTPNAITTGVEIDALLAVADGREEDLEDDDRQVVDFIRRVRDGEMTDEAWAAMIERVGTLRGTIELAYFVCALWSHHTMMRALGVPGMDEQAWREMLEEFRSGERDVEAATAPYVAPTLNRA
jgi:hypothetical protein